MSNSTSRKILVVDDEPYMHRLMAYHLGRTGYQLSFAKDGKEAIAKASSENPDLILLDVMMAEMDGLSALKKLKETEATRAIPVVMITASALSLTRQEAEASGAVGFFTKPFSPTQLLREIKMLLPEAGVA